MAEEKKKKEENKAPGWAWTALLATSIVMVIIVHAFSSKTSEEKTGTTAATQNWQLYWEKNPDATMDTPNMMPSQPVLAVIRRNHQSVIIAYKYGDKNGTMTGNSNDGISYDGNWEDKEGYGNFHLRFASNDSAVGWVDDKGEKPINLWLIKI